jgi:putative transposase
LWDAGLHHPIFLGDEDFVVRVQAQATPGHTAVNDVPRAQRAGPPRGLAAWLALHHSRQDALWMAVRQGGITRTAVASELGLSVSRVSRLIVRAEIARDEDGSKDET